MRPDPYSDKIRNIAAHLGQANPEYVHPFMKVERLKTAGLIVVTTDKAFVRRLEPMCCAA